MDLTTTTFNKAVTKNVKSDIGKITIVSARHHVVSGITTQLRMIGCSDFTTINSSFNDEFGNDELSLSEYVIIDIENFRDATEIARKVKYLIPITAKKIFIGDVDSISFNDEMKRIGVCYLHLDSQLMQLGSVLRAAGEENEDISKPQIISILGCKGGSGTSLVAWWFFQSIGKLSHLPVLLVQGHTGSADLDLIADVAIQRDGAVTSLNTHQALKIATEEEQWKIDGPEHNNYNIIILDYNVTAQVRDQLNAISPVSDFIFVVVTRELSSVRNARLVLDELSRNSTSVRENDGLSKHIVILNDISPAKNEELTNDDVENYLARKVDIFCSYQKDVKKIDANTDLYSFAAKMLGKNLSFHSKERNKKSIFSAMPFFNKK